jgi:hypothetical protein
MQYIVTNDRDGFSISRVPPGAWITIETEQEEWMI